jgi:hypothetical protein
MSCATAVWSIYYGVRGVVIEIGAHKKGPDPEWYRILVYYVHVFIFNSAGSFAGWFCVYALAIRVRFQPPGLTGFAWVDALLFVFAMLGLTGHLPQALVGFLRIFDRIGEKVAEKLA